MALGMATLAVCLADSVSHTSIGQLIINFWQAPGPIPFSMASGIESFG